MTQAIRTFFAVPIPAPVRARLGEVVDTMRGRPGGDRVRWVRPANFHVTLRFLGDLFPSVVPDLVAAVREEVAEVGSFTCRLGDVHLFPSARRPRVVAVGLAADGHLRELVEAIERGVVRTGLSAEDRGFRGHLTLGRVRGRPLFLVPDDAGLEGVDVGVDRVVLLRSELGRGGAVYEELESVRLGAG